MEDLCLDISKALSLLRTLEVKVASLGGPSAILLGKMVVGLLGDIFGTGLGTAGGEFPNTRS